MQRIDARWWIVLTCVAIQALVAGATTYSFSLFALEFESEFQASRATVMWAASGHALASALLAPQLGLLLDRHSARKVVIGATLCLAGGLMLAARATTILQLILSWSLLVSIGTTTLTALLAPVLLTRWFTSQRGLALGIASMGTKIGGLAVPPVVAIALAYWPWREVLQGLSLGLVAVIVLLAWRFLIEPPRERLAAAPGAAAPTPMRVNWRALFRVPGFWLLALYLSVMLATFAVLLSNLAMLAASIGASRTDAAMLLSIFSLVGLAASPLVGRMCDRYEPRLVGTLLALVNATAIAIFLGSGTLPGFRVAIVLVALGGGGISTLFGVLASRLFDAGLYGRAVGSVLSCAGLAAAMAPVAAGWLYDRTGNYEAALSVLVALLLGAAVLSPFIRARSPVT